tara:strand:+ start:2186 stop:2434 length:249 start_codon:yes stop_codon:yes gene_type:complete
MDDELSATPCGSCDECNAGIRCREIPCDAPSTDTMLAVYYALHTASGLIGMATHADEDTRRRVASQAYDHIEEAMLRLEGEM